MNKNLILTVVILLLAFVIIGQIVYLLYKQDDAKSPSVSQREQLNSNPSLIPTPTVNIANKAFSQVVINNLLLINKSDRVAGIVNLEVEASIISIDRNGTDKFFNYIMKLTTKDKMEKYPENYFYITPELLDKTIVVIQKDDTTEPATLADLHVGDTIIVAMEWDIANATMNAVQHYKITKLE